MDTTSPALCVIYYSLTLRAVVASVARWTDTVIFIIRDARTGTSVHTCASIVVLTAICGMSSIASHEALIAG